MNMNTKPNGWNRKERAAAARVAKVEGVDVSVIQKEAIRAHVRHLSRGALYRADILGSR